MEEVLLFANPIAGRGRGRVIASRVWEALTRAGYAVRAFFDPPEGIELDRLRGAQLPRAAITIGGDGTLRVVAHRLLQAFDPTDMPPLLVVPLGTANLMVKHLGIPWTGHDAAVRVQAAVTQRKVVQLDAARANGSLFLLMAGVGIDGQLVHELARVRRGPIDLVSYLFPAALAFHKYAYPALTVHVDGRRVFGPAPGMAFIGNVAEYGTGFPILPHARSDDRLLDVCVLPCKSRTQVLELLLHVAASEHVQAEGVVYLTGKQIRVDSDQAMPVQVDGEAAGHTPLKIELLPVQVPFIVP